MPISQEHQKKITKNRLRFYSKKYSDQETQVLKRILFETIDIFPELDDSSHLHSAFDNRLFETPETYVVEETNAEHALDPFSLDLIIHVQPPISMPLDDTKDDSPDFGRDSTNKPQSDPF